MKKYNGPAVRNGTTHTGKLPDNIGFPGNMKGVTRKLSKAELRQQKRNLKTLNLADS